MDEFTAAQPARPRLGRIPPQNSEAEQAVLGSILLRERSLPEVVDILRADDFYRDAHQVIFRAMLALFEKNERIDPLTVGEFLRAANLEAKAGGDDYLATLTSRIPVASNIAAYARIVRQKAILRRLIEAGTDITARCYDEQHDIDQLIDDAEQAIFDIAGRRGEQQFVSVKEIAPEAFRQVERLFQRKELITGVPTGFKEFDNMTAGLQPSDLIVIAARPSMGKTAFALNIAQHAALKDKIGVAVFSLEMSKEQLALRLLSSVGSVDSRHIRTGSMQGDDWPNLVRALALLEESPIFIDDTPAISVLEMRSKLRRLAAKEKIGLVIVDYLQLMSGRSSENRTQEISDISRSLKVLAKAHNLPVVALSQLNRAVETRTDKRPMLADLRESGAIEQDADVIAFIYRDEVYNKSETNPERGYAEIIIGKQRNGPTGTIKLVFRREVTRFDNPSLIGDAARFNQPPAYTGQESEA
jgi:replicative DNA helicase